MLISLTVFDRKNKMKDKRLNRKANTMINPKTLFEIKSAWSTFDQNHPRFKQFLAAARNNALQEGSVIDISIKTPEGQTMCTNLKLTQSDLELFEKLRQMQG